MFAEARKYEARGEYERAAKCFAELFKRRALTEREVVEFALFCWQMTEYGFSSGNNLSVDVVHELWGKLSECMKLISEYDEGDTESHFWLKFIKWAEYGESLTVDECSRMLEMNAAVKEPALYVFMCSGGDCCKGEALFLEEKYRDERTLKGRYILSVLASIKSDRR